MAPRNHAHVHSRRRLTVAGILGTVILVLSGCRSAVPPATPVSPPVAPEGTQAAEPSLVGVYAGSLGARHWRAETDSLPSTTRTLRNRHSSRSAARGTRWQSSLQSWQLRCPSGLRRDAKKSLSTDTACRLHRPSDRPTTPDRSCNPTAQLYRRHRRRIQPLRHREAIRSRPMPATCCDRDCCASRQSTRPVSG
jgi:hypothetical protein